jgi:uncharacterized protein YecE (DUF72 family)
MRLFVGTSGYSYKEWKGSFYPEKLSQAKMLAYYAERFNAVESNSTFRKLPSEGVVAAWAEQVPSSFRFALKAPQTITHRKRLQNAKDLTDQFLRIASLLERQQGPLLFQLPPNFKKDIARLEQFLRVLGTQAKSAFEFRHASWFDEETFACLRKYKVALCIADAEELPRVPFVAITNWSYLRLRRKSYTTKQLQAWSQNLRAAKLQEAYVFFKHEETGTGPKFAARFLKLAGA